MYLKSLEVQGFKAFANKIVFEFHNGITGIVGPNGSGKSNVADAVRWVLGEQSAKQLRGSSMQDVIFAGTENRKPLSYAYVAITLDNSDHQLAIDYEEVTVARRVYRSGESEYLLNGTPCRLKEVSELFYDTGIGKEGYSIIGQGQIDRILSGKPEERRELFDEAAGIVKYKKRRTATQKKLERERENLVRINDILSELERQVGPLERQSEKARQYLRKREELKDYEVNLFLMESERIAAQNREYESAHAIAQAQLDESNASYEKVRLEYETLEQQMTQQEEQIGQIRQQISDSTVLKEKLKSQIDLLTEQIHTAETTDEHLQGRLDAIEQEKQERLAASQEYDGRRAGLDAELAAARTEQAQAAEALAAIQERMAGLNEQAERGQQEVIELLNRKIELEAAQQRSTTMKEQVTIRKAQLNQRLLERKSKEGDLEGVVSEYRSAYDKLDTQIAEKKKAQSDLDLRIKEWKIKKHENSRRLEEARSNHMQLSSRLETLRNIAERYDGYGNSIRRVMERKAGNPGILGVVSDLIQVEKKYEIAIETALGGSIQNIVTEDEETAKRMIAYLKENRYGRATFLPLTSVSSRGGLRNESALEELGVLGLASNLVQCEERFRKVAEYLLGRILVVDTIDHALQLARKFHYSLNIVTLEGEHLSPGGSLSGGAFKNSSNLLARNREIEEMEKKRDALEKEIEQLRNRDNDISTALELNTEEMEEITGSLQELYLQQNTAAVNLDRVKQQQEESESAYQDLSEERSELDAQLEQIQEEQERAKSELTSAEQRQNELKEQNDGLAKQLDEQSALAADAEHKLSQIRLTVAGIEQNLGFLQENIDRVSAEVAKFDTEKQELVENAVLAREDVEKKRQDIEQIRQSIAASEEGFARLEQTLTEALAEKDRMSVAYKGCFAQREEISETRAKLDKELFRLNTQKEKLDEALESQTNYIWEEYELAPHAASAFRNEAYTEIAPLRKLIASCKEEIRGLGSVNVNAIEEYKEVSERYEFLKGQHDDLVEAEQTLLGIIDELNQGMTAQFTEKFAEIQKEYDASFRQLFGGGHGRLELVEGEDILECGIRIIAQPPGKKLQNMMQLSGGEKALSAIALLFAIQALKPSPFCLLDEIEAALDDANVGRFANYLQRLSDNTQFIVITHRRGTMAAADRLYGITMQEKGVSALVSVDLVESDLDD